MNGRLPARLVLLCLIGAAFGASAQPLSGLTEDGKYAVTLSPEGSEIPIGPLHSWVLELRTADDETFVPRQLGIYGGMPEHGHGLPSEPQPTEQLAAGEYRIDGVRFNMAGRWQMTVGVVGPAGADKITFDFNVAPRAAVEARPGDGWTAAELALLQSLLLTLPPPVDPSNRFVGDPRAIALGKSLFFDPKLSTTGEVSCASCHQPELKFTDGLKLGVGSSEVSRHTPTLLGVAHAEWFYWDGRRDSLWSQSVTPLETTGEMDNNRLAVIRYVLQSSDYGPAYTELAHNGLSLSALPENAGPYGNTEERSAWSRLTEPQRQAINATFANIGKFIASYVATLQPETSRFDRFATQILRGDSRKAQTYMSDDEIAGLRLYLDSAKTQCLRCHNGPLFTNHGFHNIGTALDDRGRMDMGRIVGLSSAQHDPFNCRGGYSDVPPGECDEFRFGNDTHASMGAFKVPSLRNAGLTAPYMHDGRFATLKQVVDYYRSPPEANVSGHELPVLDLTERESRQLAAFIGSLDDSER